MIFGVATWPLQGDSLAERFRKLADMGFQAVSMVEAQHKEAEANWDAVQAVLEKCDLQLTIHLCCGISGGPGLDGALPPQIATVVEWQKRSGRIRNVTFDSAYRPEAVGSDKAWNKEGTIEGLRYACDQLSPLGIRVGIENWLINHRLDQFQAMKDGVDRKELAMLLDVGHLHIALNTPSVEIPSSQAWILDAPFEIIELHIHDNDGKSDYHLPVGDGTIDLRPMAAGLAARGFDGVATIELAIGGSKMLDDEVVRGKITRTRDAFETAFRNARRPGG